MKKEEDIFKRLIAGGVIGGALGAILSKHKDQGIALGALAGAVILATFEANEEAVKSEVPVLVEMEGAIFKIYPNGSKEFVKEIEAPQTSIPDHFLLD